EPRWTELTRVPRVDVVVYPVPEHGHLAPQPLPRDAQEDVHPEAGLLLQVGVPDLVAVRGQVRPLREELVRVRRAERPRNARAERDAIREIVQRAGRRRERTEVARPDRADVRHAPPLRLDPPPVVARADLEPNTRGEKRGTALVDEVRGKSVFLRRRERDRTARTVVAPERLDPDRGAVAPIERGSVVARLQIDGRAPQRELRSHLPGHLDLLVSVAGVRAVELGPAEGAGQ